MSSISCDMRPAALRTRFDKQRDSVLGSVDARSKDRLRFLSNSIDTRKERESDDIRQVLDDLDKALRAELVADREPQQLSLFSEDERTQLRRDHAALEARLARIPLEREQEVRAIENRYSNVRDHTFPVAVILLVPASLTKLSIWVPISPSAGRIRETYSSKAEASRLNPGVEALAILLAITSIAR